MVFNAQDYFSHHFNRERAALSALTYNLLIIRFSSSFFLMLLKQQMNVLLYRTTTYLEQLCIKWAERKAKNLAQSQAIERFHSWMQQWHFHERQPTQGPVFPSTASTWAGQEPLLPLSHLSAAISWVGALYTTLFLLAPLFHDNPSVSVFIIHIRLSFSWEQSTTLKIRKGNS